MTAKKFRGSILPFLVLGILFFPRLSAAQLIKVRVTVDNASIKVTPAIGGKNLATVPLNTILDAEPKQGEFYKVYLVREGVQLAGYLHEMLVEEVAAGETGPTAAVGAGKTEAEILAEIGLKIEESRNLIRQKKEFERAISGLRPLIAKMFNIEDRRRQKELATEIFLWIGLAYAGKGDGYNALVELKNMFEVDYAYAKNITRNILDPEVVGFIDHAEKQYKGIVTEYSLEIVTEPKEAVIKIDGKEIGLSPEVYRTSLPKFTVEVEKRGYQSIKEDVFLAQPSTKKEYTLESLGRTLDIRSVPPGAHVLLDGEDTGKVTNCEVPFVPFGPHKLNLKRDNYAGWEDWVEVKQGEGSVPVEVILTANTYAFFFKWGGPGQEFFELPKGIGVDREDNFYIVDRSDVKLKKFDKDGNFIRAWGGSGRESKGLKEAVGVAVDSQGFIYVVDAENHNVSKFNSAGRFVSKWGKGGDKEEEMRNPQDIAVDSKDNIYVVDSGNSRVKKYTTAGALQMQWGTRGTSDGSFIMPSAVAVSPDDEIYVLDRVRVQKFSPEGTFLQAWGKAGTGEGEFNRAQGMFIDSYGYVYVADSGNNRVQKFDAGGKLIALLGGTGTGDGQMAYPCGVAVNSQGHIIVVEQANNRVQMFRVPQ